jgi:prophage antirepressor-like protein
LENLQIFKNEEFGEVRAIEKDGDILFTAKDVCDALGLTNTTVALQRLDPDEVTKLNLGGLAGETNFINEYGLFNLVLASRKPSARLFKRWITHEVLPSIRQNGGYIANQEQLTPEQIVANALVVAQNIIQQKDKLITEMKPKADFFDAVADSKTAVAIGDVAKALGVKGIGRNNLFEILRDRKILMQNNRPYQKYVDCGYFRVIEQHYSVNGEEQISFKTLVYQKGIDYIRKIVA